MSASATQTIDATLASIARSAQTLTPLRGATDFGVERKLPLNGLSAAGVEERVRLLIDIGLTNEDLSCGRCLLLKTSTLPAVVFYSDPLILEFIAGGTIGVIYCQRERGCRTTALTLLGLGLTLLWPLTEFGFKAHPHHLMRLAAWGIPAALIVGGCVFYEKYLQNQNRRLPHVGWLMTLAAWSYPLYLSHIMAFVLVKTGILSLKPPGPLYAAALLGGALLIAWLLHVMIEWPTQQLGRKALARWFQLPGETAEEIKKLNPR